MATTENWPRGAPREYSAPEEAQLQGNGKRRTAVVAHRDDPVAAVFNIASDSERTAHPGPRPPTIRR